ncbi:MAG: hypothetical protein ACLP53_27260 [Isosphaeraceae bacterium]
MSPMFLSPSPRHPHLSFPDIGDFGLGVLDSPVPNRQSKIGNPESAATSYHTSPMSPSDLMGTPWGFIPIVDAAKIGQSINKKRPNRSANRSSIPVRSLSFSVAPESTQVFQKKVDHYLSIRQLYG